MTDPTTESRLDALRRSTDDKLVAGVAGGIAKAVNIDPVIVRIGFVVLTFVGFAGPVLYAACWLLVPVEGARRSALGDAFDVRSDSQLRTTGLIIAAVLAAGFVLGDTAWGPAAWFWGPMWALAWIAIPVAALYWLFVVRPRQAARTRFTPPPPYRPESSAPFAATATDQFTAPTAAGDDAMTETIPESEATAVLDDPGPPPAPPGVPPASVLPPRPPRERWSPALLLLTLSAILVAMGALALWSVTQDPLEPAVYPAVALGIVALGLLVGTKTGHPGALIPVGLLLVPVLAVASVVPNLDGGSVDLSPTTAASIAEPIEQGFGDVRVDLTSIKDLETLTGRTLEIENGVGQTTVYVPEDLDVSVDASLSLGGRVVVFGKVQDGSDPSIAMPSDAPGAYRIVITGTAGEIQVVRT